MELQQNLNLTTRILKKTVVLQHIYRDDLSLISKGSNQSVFLDFTRYDNIALKERLVLRILVLGGLKLGVRQTTNTWVGPPQRNNRKEACLFD